MCLAILHAGRDRRVLVKAVDTNGRLNIHDVSHGMLKIQKVDGPTLYDALEFTFNPVDKTSLCGLKKTKLIILIYIYI